MPGHHHLKYKPLTGLTLGRTSSCWKITAKQRENPRLKRSLMPRSKPQLQANFIDRKPAK